MKLQPVWIGFCTLLRVETQRYLRKWLRVLAPAALTMALYFVIFGGLVGSQIKQIDGFSYMQYITPGLIMMAIVTNSYANTVDSLFLCRFHRSIEDLAVAPLPSLTILLAFTLAGSLRGLMIGGVVLLLSLFFGHLTVAHGILVFFSAFCSALLFSLLGFTNGLFAKTFDDINIIPTFLLTPLTYFGGVFYSIHVLPGVWQNLSYLNPIFYIVNALRYSILNHADVSVIYGMGIMSLLVISLFLVNLHLLNKGVGIRI